MKPQDPPQTRTFTLKERPYRGLHKEVGRLINERCLIVQAYREDYNTPTAVIVARRTEGWLYVQFMNDEVWVAAPYHYVQKVPHELYRQIVLWEAEEQRQQAKATADQLTGLKPTEQPPNAQKPPTPNY